MNRSVVASVVLLLAWLGRAGELDIAREALRDGLWEVARTHAAKVEGPEAALVTVESYAREGRWPEALKTLEAHPDETGDSFVYYRALALARTGDRERAAAALAGRDFADAAVGSRAQLLRAELARQAGRPAEVLKVSLEKGFPSDEVEALMLVAWARQESGDADGAKEAWRKVLDAEAADERAVASAATELADVASLKKAHGRVRSAVLRRAVGLRLGVALLADKETFDEGARMVRALAKDSPDADGAKAAFLALADGLMKRESWQEAADAYRNALEAWPETSKDVSVQEGYAWALRKLGKAEEALAAFGRAETAAVKDDDIARALLAQGEVLSELGRGTDSMAKFRTVLEKYPGTPTGRSLKEKVELRELESEGRMLFRNFSFGEAQKKFAELASRSPAQRPRMDYFEMLCLYGQGQDGLAVEKAKALSAGSPDDAIKAEATLWLAKYTYNNAEGPDKWRESCALFADYATNRAPDSVRAPSALTWAARAALAAGDCKPAVDLVTRLTKSHPESPERTAAWLVQGQALVRLARHGEAIQVYEKVILASDATMDEQFRARWLKADAQFVMGADNPVRYREALDGYRALLLGDTRSPDDRLEISFKIGRTLESLGRKDEAVDQYYSEVVLAFRDGVSRRVAYSDASKGTFARAAYRLADEFERRGADDQAVKVLNLVVSSGIGSVEAEAKRRIDRLKKKGSLQ